MKVATIYVALLDEGVDCWRPVKAETLGGDVYRILDSPAEEECWEFAAGDIVRCKRRAFQEGTGLVAYEKVPVT